MHEIILYALHGGVLLYFFDDDEENEVLEKIFNFAENTVPRFNDRQFQEHFRMTPSTFETFLQQLYTVTENLHVKAEIPLDKQAMICIWCLGNLESFRSVANKFGISKSTCWQILFRTCHRVLKLNSTFHIISWPTPARALEIVDSFKRIGGFPGVIGAVDGSHIRIEKPSEFGNSYINRKGYASVLLQGVCDHKKLFIDVYAGQPGSIHDAKLFTKSDLYDRICRNEILFHHDSHLIGDLAYKLSPYLMVGFKNPGFLNERQKTFNVKLSKQRVVIENAFAVLKGRFRRLKMMETVRLDLISLLIVTACVLHNVCIHNNDAYDFIDINSELEAERLFQVANEVNEYPDDQHAAAFAIRKRLNIMNRL